MRSGQGLTGRALPLLGRDRELDRLAALVRRACADRGAAGLVVGDAGIGKTRLLQALADHVAPSLEVVWGRTSRRDDAPDLWPWTQVLRALARSRPAADLRASSHTAGIVGRAVPELADVLDVAPRPGEATPFEVLDAVATTLLHAAHARPLVVVLDDLHDADDASLDLLALLLEQVDTAPLAVVSATRPVEDASVLSELAAHSDVVVLGGLSTGEVARLARDAGHEVDDRVAARLRHETGGNPFFVLEAAALAEARDATTAEVPLAVRGLVDQRLAALAPSTRTALAATAVLGRDADEDLLAAVTGAPPEDLLTDLKTLADLGLAQRVPDRPGAWTVAHDLLRDAVLDRVAGGERHRLEAAAAAALHDRHGDAPGAAATIARHLVDAGPDAPPGAAIPYLRRAARHAADRLAWAEAARLDTEALHLLRTGGAGDGPVLAALLELGTAQARGTSPASARATFGQAIEVARRSQDPDGLAAAVLGACQADRRAPGLDMEADRLLPQLDEALAALADRRDDDAVRARLLATRALHQFLAGDPEGLPELAASAVATAEAAGDATARALAAASRRAAQGPLVPLEDRRAATDALARLAEVAADLELQWVAQRWRLTDALQAADPAGAAAAVDACLRLATRLDEPYLTALSRVWQGTLALAQGRFDDLARSTEHALAAAQAAEGAGVDTIGGQQIYRMRDQGELDPTALEALAEQYPAEQVLRALRAWGHAHAGSLDTARDVLAGMVSAGLDRLPRSEYWLATLAMLAEVTARVQDRDAAAPLLRLLSAVPDQCVLTAGGPMAWTGPLSYFTGLLRLVLDDPAGAVRDLEAALGPTRRMGARPALARVQLALAAAHTAVGDQRRATRDLAASRAAAERLGMAWLVPLQDGVAAEAGIEPPAPTADPPEAPRTVVLRRDAHGWQVGPVGQTAALPASKGLAHLHVLVSNPHLDVHVLDLVAGPGTGRADATTEMAGRRGTDAGPVLDDRAIAAYRRRLADLDEELATATTLDDDRRAARAEEERDALVAQLDAAVGLGGRRRRAGDDAERARVNVTRALRGAIDRIRGVDPVLADHLDTAVQTGRHCRYAPDPTSPITWRLTD